MHSIHDVDCSILGKIAYEQRERTRDMKDNKEIKVTRNIFRGSIPFSIELKEKKLLCSFQSRTGDIMFMFPIMHFS